MKSMWYVVCVLSLLFSSITYSKDPLPVAAQVVSTQGTVLVRDQNQALRALKPGDKLYETSTVNTGSNGSVKLLFKDRSIVDLGPSTLFTLKSYKKNQGANREVDLEMDYGSIRAAISEKIKGKGRFRVKTPQATMGVRGTEFFAKQKLSTDAIQNGSDFQVAVTQGQVNVTQSIQNAVTPLYSGDSLKLSGVKDRMPASVIQNADVTKQFQSQFENTSEKSFKVQNYNSMDSRSPASNSQNTTKSMVQKTIQSKVGDFRKEGERMNKIQSTLPGQEAISATEIQNHIQQVQQNQNSSQTRSLQISVQF